MSCYQDLLPEERVISIILTHRKEMKTKPTMFVFFGNKREMSAPLKRLAKGEKLSSQDRTAISRDFPLNSPKWFQYHERSKVVFIKDSIRTDETVYHIRRKIFKYLSSPGKYLIPENLELWVRTPSSEEEEKYRIIGYRYEGIHYQPAPYSEPTPNARLLDEVGGRRKDIDLINDNRYILRDLLNLDEPENLFIYAYPLSFELDYLKKEGIKVEKELSNGYLLLHWPDAKLGLKPEQVKSYFKKNSDELDRERYIYDLIANAPTTQHLSGCDLMSFRLEINEKSQEEFIDLLKVFNYLKENLTREVPLVIYQDVEWSSPHIVMAQEAIDEELISKERLLDWTIDMTELRKSGKVKYKDYQNTLAVRIYNHTSPDGEAKYDVLVLYNTGYMRYFINYSASAEGSLRGVTQAVAKLNTLLEQINEVDFRLNYMIPKEQKIALPEVSYRKGSFTISPNARISSTSWTGQYEGKLEREEFAHLVEVFYPFVAESHTSTAEAINLKYKRISNYKAMDEIFEMIREWKEGEDRTDQWIIQKIRTEFGKTDKQASDLLYEWKKAYRVRTEEGYVVKQSGISVQFFLSNSRFIFSGVNEIGTLVEMYDFFNSLLAIYGSLSTLLKDKKFLAVWKDPKKYLIEEAEYDELILDESNLEIGAEEEFQNGNEEEIGEALLQLADLEGEETVEAIGEEEMVLEDDKVVMPHLKFRGEVDERIDLKCTDADLVHDTCQDLCNDNNYILRRLQRREPTLYNYPTSREFPETYARKCQSGQQPIILDSNPEERTDLEKGSYTYAIKYSTEPERPFWYICPQVWCPTHEKPYPLSEVTNRRTLKTARVGSDCLVGKCPEGDHQVFWNEGGHVYPGFKNKFRAPNGQCVVCCFNKDQRKGKSFRVCMHEEDQNDEPVDVSYLFDFRNTRRLPPGRLGLLPEMISKLFQCYCPPGIIQKGMSCYLVRGIEELNPKNSFLGAVGDIISRDKSSPLSYKQVLAVIDKHLDERLFKSLSNGALEAVFYNPEEPEVSAFEMFQRFLHDDSKEVPLNEKYLWDLVCRPGVLTEEGFNLVILTKSTIVCPVGEYISEFYSADRPWAFLFEHLGSYAPIYKVKNEAGTLVYRWWFNEGVDPEVERIHKIIDDNCQQKILSMKAVLRELDKEYGIKFDFSPPPEVTIEGTAKALEGAGYEIVGQVVDKYNHTSALMLSNGLYLPVLPGGSSLRWPIVEEPRLLPYAKTVSLLREVAKKTGLPVGPASKVLSDWGVNAVLTVAERVVPVKEQSSVPDDKLPVSYWSFYPGLDQALANRTFTDDDRRREVAKYLFEEESYQRVRFEISKFIQKHPRIGDQIIEVVEAPDLSVPEKREALLPILEELFDKLVTTKGIKIEIEDYERPNIRTACHLSKKCNDPHCVSGKDGKCKLYISPVNLLNGKDNKMLFQARLADELVRIKKSRDDIIYDSVQYIVDRKRTDAPEGARVIYGDTIQRDLIELYKKRGNIYISPYTPFDRKEPTDVEMLYGEDNLFLNIENINEYWMSILSSEYKVHNNNCGERSLFCALAEALNYMSKLAREEEAMETAVFTEARLREILSKAIADLDLAQVENIVLKLDMNLPTDYKTAGELLLEIYKRIKGKSFREFKTLQDYMTDEGYRADMIDVYILSHYLKLNVALLEKFPRDIDMLFIDNGSKYYVLLLRERVKREFRYALVEQHLREGNRAVFELGDFPLPFRQKLEGEEPEE